MDESKTSAIKSTQDMIILTNLRKQYGDFVAVENTTLNVKKGEFLTFLDLPVAEKQPPFA